MSEKWICERRIFRDTWIRTLRSDKNMQITDGTIPGLYLRYSRLTNRISFYLGCILKPTGLHKNLFLGKLEDFNTIEDMKTKARNWRELIIQGIDPSRTAQENLKQEILAESENSSSPTLVETLFDQYMEKYAKLYKKPSTQKSNEAQYKLYLKPIFGQMNITDIEEQHVLDAYSTWATETSFSTANKALSLLSSFWDWCENYKYVPRRSNPCGYVKKGKNAKFQAQVLDREGYKAFFSALATGPADSGMHPRFFRTIKVLALTGCRCSEIRQLQLDEISLEEKVLHLHDSKTGPRDVKLSDAVIPELEQAIKEAELLGSKYAFPGIEDTDKPILDLRKAFNWTLETAKLPHMRIHDLRHSFISMGANMGENMVAMRNAAGHSRITTTEGYTHLADAKTFEAVNNIANAICG